jgi:hypothetical protein
MWTLLALLAVVWIASLSRNLFAPFGNDHALYQYITERVMAGDRMYADLLDHNAPGIIGIHWLSTVLFGRSPMALRQFDACWQLLTLVALIVLAGRNGRQWSAGVLAAVLYVLVFYGYGSTNTAEREGFAVLFLLMAIHAFAAAPPGSSRGVSSFFAHLMAGVFSFGVFAIKPPLGLCFGTLWVYAVVEAWQHRLRGPTVCAGLVGLTVGFLLSAMASVLVLKRLDWWDSYWPVLTGKAFPPGYVLGPTMIRMLLPYVALATGLAVTVALWAWWRRVDDVPSPRVHRIADTAQLVVIGVVVFGLLLTIVSWSRWGDMLLRISGVALPALGAIAICCWTGRSRTWRVCCLLAGVCLAALFIQGRFTPYRYAPLVAMMAYLAAGEIVYRVRQMHISTSGQRAWTMICLVAVLHLATAHWWLQMIAYSREPHVLADRTLTEHHARIVNSNRATVRYETAVEVAQRIRELTDANDPVAMLFYEPRINYMAARPVVHRMFIPLDLHRLLYEEFMAAIAARKPKVVLARLPEAHRYIRDPVAAAPIIFADAEARFGPSARVISDHYQLTELIGDVAILQPADRP